MEARCLLREDFTLSDGVRAELVVWEVPVALAGSAHNLKYRLALIVDGTCVLRFDNEAGKETTSISASANTRMVSSTPSNSSSISGRRWSSG